LKSVNVADYENMNGLKSLTFLKIFLVSDASMMDLFTF